MRGAGGFAIVGADEKDEEAKMRFGAVPVVAVLFCLPLLTVAAPARSAETVRMWDLVRAPGWDLTVRSVERRVDPLPAADGGAAVRPSGRFAVFVVDLTNRATRPQAPRSGDFVLWSAEGRRSDNLADTPAARIYAAATDLTPFGDPIAPGATVTTVVLFDVDARAGRLTLRFVPANQPIQIDECKCNLPSPLRSVTDGSS
jgi:hypothetical protein